MERKSIIKKMVAVGMIGALAVTIGCTSNADHQVVVDELTEVQKQFAQLTTDNGQLNDVTANMQAQLDQFKLDLDEKDAQLLEYEQATATAEDLAEATEAEANNTYVLDGLHIGDNVEKTFTDKQLDLFDGEVEIDGEDYDAEEIFMIDFMTLVANENDFNGDAFLSADENSVYYGYEFEDNFNSSDINDDDSLTIAFLGQEIEVVDWNENTLEINTGEEVFLTAGQMHEVEGKILTLVMTGDDYVYVKVGDEGKKIYENDNHLVNGVEIKVSEVLEATSWREGMATLIVGENVVEEIEDGDEYADDSLWTWVVTENSFGLTLNTELLSVDEDDEFDILSYGESLSLPNDFIVTTFTGQVAEDVHEYKFDVKMKDGEQYLRVKGDFVNGIKDYDEILVNEEGIFDEDLELIDSDEIEMDRTEMFLELEGNSVLIDDIYIDLDEFFDEEMLEEVLFVNEDDISDFDEDYLTNYGILISNPEDSVEDQELVLEIPEEELEFEVTVTK